MMFGFGDDQVPFTESVDLLEDLVVEYITEMVRKQDFAHIYSPIVIKEITNSMQLSLLNCPRRVLAQRPKPEEAP